MEEMPALNSSAGAGSGSGTSAHYSMFSQTLLPSYQTISRNRSPFSYRQTPPRTSAVEGLGSCSLTHTVWEKVIISAMANWTTNNLSLHNSGDAPLKKNIF